MAKGSFKNIEKMLGKADLHIHSNYSDAKPTIEEILDYVDKKTELDLIAITDHDTIDGAVEAQRIAKIKKYHFDIIVGEEVSTKEGHIIGLFLKKAVPSGLSAHDTVKNIKAQNGIVFAPHALRHIRFNTGKVNVDGVGFTVLLKEKKYIDAIETINATPTLYEDNLKAMFFNDVFLFKAEVGGSDAHILDAIGMGYTVFEGKTAGELKEAILHAQTRSLNKRWKLISLFKYLFFFFPKGLRLFLNTLVHGRRPKRMQIINIPTKLAGLSKESLERDDHKW